MKDDAKVDGPSDGVNTGQYLCVAGIRALVLDRLRLSCLSYIFKTKFVHCAKACGD